LGIMGFNRRKLEDGRREAAEKEAASRVTYTLLSLHAAPAAPYRGCSGVLDRL
jgi:hypothetical protein